MKALYINILMVASVIAMLIVYRGKEKHANGAMEQLKSGLSGLKPILRPGTKVSYMGIPNDPNSHEEVVLMCRYLLAPAILMYEQVDQNDSALILLSLQNDNPDAYIKPGNSIIWENRDRSYHYLFIKRNTK